MTKRYYYTNNLGYHKTLVVHEEKNGRCKFEIFGNGELCSTGTASKQQTKEFLALYIDSSSLSTIEPIV